MKRLNKALLEMDKQIKTDIESARQRRIAEYKEKRNTKHVILIHEGEMAIFNLCKGTRFRKKPGSGGSFRVKRHLTGMSMNRRDYELNRILY